MPTFDSNIDRTGADALIPVEYANQIIKNLPTQSAALSLMKHVPMSRKQQRLPVLSALAQAYWVGGDTGLKQTTKEMWEGKFLVAEELAAIIPVPQAVLDDETFDIWGEVQPELEAAAGALIDAAVLFGAGKPASFPGGIVPDAIAAGNTVNLGDGGDAAIDVSDVMATVEGEGFTVNGFAADVTFRATLRNLRTSSDGQVLLLPLTGQAAPGRPGEPQMSLYYQPLFYSNNGAFDTTDALLIAGDWTKAILGIRQDITYSIHTEGVISDDSGAIVLNLMQQDSAAIRMVMRLGFVEANPVTRKQATEADRFPFGVLAPASS